MRIAMICREMPPVGGGAGAVALQLARQLVIAGHEVVFFTMQDGDQSTHESVHGVRIVRIHCGRRGISSARTIEMLRFLMSTRRRLRSEHSIKPFDVVHAHSVLPEGAALFLHEPCARTVITAHGSDVPGYNPDRYELLHRAVAGWWRAVVRKADAVTAPSEFLAGLIRRASPDRDVLVIPNGIEADLFAESDERDGVLIVARLVPRKNVDIVLEALRGLPATRVDIVGDGPQLPRLRSLSANLGHHDVRFHGWLEHGSREWRSLYEESRFFVFMSSQENFPVNLLEAQLAGLVTVASDIPSNREVLGNDAEFVAIDAESLRGRLLQLMSEPLEKLAERQGRARDRVTQNFLWPSVGQKFEDAYRRDD